MAARPPKNLRDNLISIFFLSISSTLNNHHVWHFLPTTYIGRTMAHVLRIKVVDSNETLLNQQKQWCCDRDCPTFC